MSQVAAVIVTRNRLELLKECIAAVKSQTLIPEIIIVVNNGSIDGTMEWLASQKNLLAINQENTGGAGGFFSGIKSAYRMGADFIWLLDDDAIPETNCLNNLFIAFNTIPEISFAASLVESVNGDKVNIPQIDFRINNLTKYPDWAKNIDDGYIKIKKTTFVSLLISRKSIKNVGLPIKEFFIWADDYEYTNRLSDYKPGYLVIHSKVIHKSQFFAPPILAIENNIDRIHLHFYATRNRVYLLRKQKSGLRKWMSIFIYFLSFSKCFGQIHTLKKIKVFYKGFFTGLFFNPKIEHVD